MKVTLEQIESKIKGETYLVLPDGKSTLCILDLENGFSIKGLSACVDPKEFNLELGRKYAREEAVRQIWPLEGYLLAEQIYQDNKVWGVAAKAGIVAEANRQFNIELRKHVDVQKPTNPKKHWTQTPAGKAKMAARKKARK
jgi:hypothetical protein